MYRNNVINALLEAVIAVLMLSSQISEYANFLKSNIPAFLHKLFII